MTRFAHGGVAACAGLAVLAGALVIAVLAGQAAGLLATVSIGELFGDTVWRPGAVDPRFGLWPLITGTLLTAGIALLVAIPLGLLAAIHLSELASSRARAVLKPAIEVLAGVPTIAYGVFAVLAVIPALQTVLPGLAGFNALAAGLVIGLMIVPTVASLSEDALHAVPQSVREAAYALGAPRLQTILMVVLPSAASGIAAAVLLALSRAAGETMIMALAAGHQPQVTLDPTVPIETMTGYLLRASTAGAPEGTAAHQALFTVGAALFLLTFAANLLGLRLSRRLRRRAVPR